MKKKNSSKKGFTARFEKFSARVTKITGSPFAFLIALLVIITWGVTGPVFKFSDTWQLVINTGTTIITFLMVFIIQQSQNKDTAAVQLKLNELIASSSQASNRLIVVEELTADELEVLKKFYIHLARLAKKESDIHSTHSIDEADTSHQSKLKSRAEAVSKK